MILIHNAVICIRCGLYCLTVRVECCSSAAQPQGKETSCFIKQQTNYKFPKDFQVGTERTSLFWSFFCTLVDILGQRLTWSHLTQSSITLGILLPKLTLPQFTDLQGLCKARAATQSCIMSGAMRCLCKVWQKPFLLVFPTNNSKHGLNWTQPYNKTKPLLVFFFSVSLQPSLGANWRSSFCSGFC